MISNNLNLLITNTTTNISNYIKNMFFCIVSISKSNCIIIIITNSLCIYIFGRSCFNIRHRFRSERDGCFIIFFFDCTNNYNISKSSIIRYKSFTEQFSSCINRCRRLKKGLSMSSKRNIITVCLEKLRPSNSIPSLRTLVRCKYSGKQRYISYCIRIDIILAKHTLIVVFKDRTRIHIPIPPFKS